MSAVHPKIQLYESTLIAHFKPTHIQMIDDSHLHAGHAGHHPGGASHLTLHIVSDQFQDLSRVARHRLVYDILGHWMKSDIHALVINAKTPTEN